MDKITEITRPQEQVDSLRTTATDRRSLYSKLAQITYQCIVVAGMITAIFILMELQQQEIQKEPNVMKKPSLILPLNRATNYVVYNPSCKIPDYPKFSQDVLPYYKKVNRTKCSSKPLLTSVTRSRIDSNYVLNLHESYLSHYVKDGRTLVCCYYVVYTRHENYKVGKCRTFETAVTLGEQADLVGVTCWDGKNSTVYKMHHFLVPIKGDVRDKLNQFHHDDHSNDALLSVMIVGLDSVSRLNMMRTMPETTEYMERKGWYTFPGYHKIQWNTFYNLVGPILTGHLGDQLKEFCWPDESNSIDNCPYIWKNFSERHYITAYGEDYENHSSFKWLFRRRNEFRKQPTDYYLAPHLSVTYRTFGSPSLLDIPRCVGPIQEAEYLLDFSADFASSFVNYPTFSLFWLNTGHDALNGPQALDKKFITYFSSLESSGALNRSMIVFLADHGFHKDWSKFSETDMGLLEYGMPFLYIWLPEWFKRKNPYKVRNLARNKHRLVSHFDVHLTLMDVLGIKTTAAGCPSCASLFDPIPWNRGCDDAGISGDICACDNYEDITVDSLVVQMAERAVAKINTLAAKYSKYLEAGYKCSTMRLKSVKRARREVLNKSDVGTKYLVDFFVENEIATSEDALFETVITIYPPQIKSVTQYSQYNERSSCMNARDGKQWCTCERVRDEKRIPQ